jgi:MOSC domain-containing protein YiiM
MAKDQYALSIDSTSVGVPARFRSFADLVQMLEAFPGAPKDKGRVSLVVRKGPGGLREILHRIVLTPENGVPGDAWSRRAQADPEAQIAVMQKEVAQLIANGQPLTLFGDNLFLELDLSTDNLPTGTRVQVGGTLMEVTPKPHNGCHKFRARFGDEALQFVSARELRHRNLRGIYLRVIESGEVGVGDPVEIIWRGDVKPQAKSGI